jgi:hypothetical protein
MGVEQHDAKGLWSLDSEEYAQLEKQKREQK